MFIFFHFLCPHTEFRPCYSLALKKKKIVSQKIEQEYREYGLLWFSHDKTIVFEGTGCQQKRWRNVMIFKKILIYLKFSGLTKLKKQTHITCYLHKTTKCYCWIRKIEVNRDCIKLVNAILGFSYFPVIEVCSKTRNVRNLAPQAWGEMRGRGKTCD